MKALLSKNQNRQIEIVDYLVRAKSWVHIDELAKAFNVSTRAIKIDLAFLRDKIEGLNILFSTNGVRIEMPCNMSTEIVYPYYFKHSICFEILEHLFLHENTTVAEMTQKLFITPSTLNRYIQKINTTLKKKFDFQISKKNLQFIGNEQDIRFFFVQYFSEKNAFFPWPFEFVAEEPLERFLLNLFKSSNFPQSFENFRIFKMVFAVNFFRSYKGHFVPSVGNTDRFFEYYHLVDGMDDLIVQFVRETGLAITSEILQQSVYIFLQPHFFLSIEEFAQARTQNERDELSYNTLEENIKELEKKYQLTCDNYNVLLWHLHNTSQLERVEMHSDYILFDKKLPLLEFFKSLNPHLYYDVADMLEAYQHAIKKSNRQRNISHLIYTFYTHWEGLVPQLQLKQENIKVLILNDFDPYFPKFLAAFLEQNALKRFVYESYEGLELSIDLLKKHDCQVILSNFSLPEIPGKKIICTHNLSMIELVNELNKI